MSMMSGMGRAPEVGEKVASYRDYEAAAKAVSKLIAADVPARDIAIVGSSLRSVERVTGRLGWAQAAWSGALNGLFLGLLFGAMVLIWTPGLTTGGFLGVLILGVAVGMVFRLSNYMVVRRRRDFASVMQVAADHYEVSVKNPSLAKARQVLGAAETARPVRVDPTALTEPPRYGVRVDPRTGRPVPPAAPDAPAEAPAPEAPAATSTGPASAEPERVAPVPDPEPASPEQAPGPDAPAGTREDDPRA